MKVFFAVVLMAATGVVSGQEITTCRAPAGKVFYHYVGGVNKESAGWSDDKISRGVFTLTKVGEDDFDILYVDIRGKPISSAQDGAIVRLLRRSADTITVLVYYANATTEIYSFFREKDGKNRFTLLQNKTGGDALLPKSSLMVGDCSAIDFDK